MQFMGGPWQRPIRQVSCAATCLRARTGKTPIIVISACRLSSEWYSKHALAPVAVLIGIASAVRPAKYMALNKIPITPICAIGGPPNKVASVGGGEPSSPNEVSSSPPSPPPPRTEPAGRAGGGNDGDGYDSNDNDRSGSRPWQGWLYKP
jgi:hypothetical protein